MLESASSLLTMPGAAALVKETFTKVFSQISVAGDAWFTTARLRSIGRKKFLTFMMDAVGRFPLFGTQKYANVDASYIRVAIVDELERDRYRSPEQISAALLRQKKGKVFSPVREQRGKPLLKVLESMSTAIAVLGSAGSGKTTMLRHLAIQLAKGHKVRGKLCLPLFLAVRDLATRNLGIHEGVVIFLRELGFQHPDKVFEKLLTRGEVVVLLDGLDEVKLDYQTRLLGELLTLRDKYSQAVYCVSARPYSLDRGLPGFDKWETLPLKLAQRLEFVEKWFAFTDPKKGQRFLKECSGKPGLLDLGSNPLLLSLVCALYYNDLKVPSEPDELYARMIEGLMGKWDAFRNIARHSVLKDLNVRRRAILVSWIATEVQRNNWVVFDARSLREKDCLGKFCRACRTKKLDEQEVLQALYSDFGLLVERSPGSYSFSHLTFQEYLTAQYIVDQRQELALLNTHIRDQAWFEVIRLVARMLPNADAFIESLMDDPDLRDPYVANLIAAVWEAKPICDPDIVIKSFTSIAGKLVNAVDKAATDVQMVDDTLAISVPGFGEKFMDWAKMGRTKRERARRAKLVERRKAKKTRYVEMIRNIGTLHRGILAQGISYQDLGCANNEPFKTIKGNPGFSRVEICGEIGPSHL